MKERESNVDAGGFLWLFQFPVNADGFFILSLCAVCIPVQQKIPAAAAAALINLLRYNIKCVCVCVFGTCLISRFLFILIWFLFMLLKFIRCHAVDFTLMSEFRSSHSETDFKSVQCTLLALRVFKLYYLFNFTKKNFSWFDDDGISVCVSKPYQSTESKCGMAAVAHFYQMVNGLNAILMFCKADTLLWQYITHFIVDKSKIPWKTSRRRTIHPREMNERTSEREKTRGRSNLKWELIDEPSHNWIIRRIH